MRRKAFFESQRMVLAGTYSAVLEGDLAETEVETKWVGGAWIISSRPSSLPTLISSTCLILLSVSTLVGRYRWF